MKIGVIGSGAVGGTLGRLWAAAGHTIMVSSRHSEKLAGLVAEIGHGATSGTPIEAAHFADVVLLAVNYATVDEATASIREAVSGRIVIDATNPLIAQPDGGLKHMLGDGELAIEVMEARLPGARVVKAFTTMWTGYLDQNSHRAGERAGVPFASDDVEAKEVVAGLIRNAGFEAVDLGTAADSRPLDPPSAIWNKVLTAAEIRARVAGAGA